MTRTAFMRYNTNILLLFQEAMYPYYKNDYHPHLTAIKRTDLSVPIRFLLQHDLLKGRILD